MIAYEGQGIIELYISALSNQTDISQDEIDYWVDGNTNITYAQFTRKGIQFRMSTDVKRSLPICQYVTVSSMGEIGFRLYNNWFVPGDICFDTFRAALRYIEIEDELTELTAANKLAKSIV